MFSPSFLLVKTISQGEKKEDCRRATLRHIECLLKNRVKIKSVITFLLLLTALKHDLIVFSFISPCKKKISQGEKKEDYRRSQH
ncbi:MAG: hypothetical protein ACI92O_001879 [Colwellia sp.]